MGAGGFYYRRSVIIGISCPRYSSQKHGLLLVTFAQDSRKCSLLNADVGIKTSYCSGGGGRGGGMSEW